MIKMENEYLLDYIGQTKSNKISNDIHNYVLEQKIKDCFNLPMAIIDLHNPNDKEILGLGVSITNDLILDNFGKMMNCIVGMRTTTLQDDSDNPIQCSVSANTVNVFTYGFNLQRTPDNITPIGSKFKLGDSGLSPTRTDFKINNDLPSSPEKDYQNSGLGIVNSGLGSITTSRAYPNAIGTGTVKEFGFFIQLKENNFDSPRFTFMMSHDLISPNVSFIAGQILNTEIVWKL